MKRLCRGVEGLQWLLFIFGLGLPLLVFYARTLSGVGSTAILSVLLLPQTLRALGASVLLASLSSLGSTAMAFLFSWILWRFRWPRGWARLVGLVLKVPYFLPAFFIAMGWIALAAPEVGYLNLVMRICGASHFPSIYGLSGALFVMTLWSTALGMIQLQGFFTQFPGSLEDAAIVCGASPLTVFRRITIPLARPHLWSCLLLTCVTGLAAFGIPALLAAPEREYVLTTRIYQSVKSSQNLSEASSLSILLLALTVLVIGIQKLIAAKSRVITASLVTGKAVRPCPLRPDVPAKIFFGAALLTGLLSCVFPMAALTWQSFLRDRSDLLSFTLEKYRYVFFEVPEGPRALFNSVLTSFSAATTVTALGLITAYGAVKLRHRAAATASGVWSFGYALPGTIIALAFLVCFSGILTDTLAILALAYAVKYAAFPLRTLEPALGSLGREMEEAAWMSGASPLRGFAQIVVPLLKPALAASLILALIPMMSELTISVFLVGADTETLGTLIYRFMEYADPGSAAVLAVVMTATSLLLNAGLRLFSKGNFGL